MARQIVYKLAFFICSDACNRSIFGLGVFGVAAVRVFPAVGPNFDPACPSDVLGVRRGLAIILNLCA